jgi:hypothetical protein
MAKDDIAKGARNLGALGSKPRKAQGFFSSNITSLNFVDYYKFNLSGRSSVSVVAKGLKSGAELQLLDSEQKILAPTTQQKNKTKPIKQTLDAGQYFIEVTQFSASGKYTLKASASTPSLTDDGPGSGDGSTSGPPPLIPSKEPGDIPALAFDTGVLTGAKAYRNTVGGADAADFYRFSLSQSSKVQFSTSNVKNGKVNTSLIYDINGNGLVDQGDTIAPTESTKSLGAGTYFVSVTSSDSAVATYDLKLEATAITGINPTVDPPLGLGGARDLGALSGSVGVKQFVGSVDSTDIYKFTLSQVSNFTTLLNSSQQTGDVTMSLIYDVNGNGIANPGEKSGNYVIPGDFIGGVVTGSSAGGSALAITKTLGAGTYYLAVTQKKLTDNSTYDLNLFVNNTVTGITPTTDPGGSMASSFDMGALNAPANYRQFVGSVDDSDFYRFTLDQPRNIIISYNGSPELVALRFGVDRNGNGVFDPAEDKDKNGRITFNEDLNNNGILDPGEDTNKDGYLERSEDTNLNGILDPNEVYESQLSGDIVYSPLPPFYDGTNAKFDDAINGFTTTVPTNIYAKLPAGTYFFEVEAQASSIDLGDSLTRYGSANVLYNLAFSMDG